MRYAPNALLNEKSRSGKIRISNRVDKSEIRISARSEASALISKQIRIPSVPRAKQGLPVHLLTDVVKLLRCVAFLLLHGHGQALLGPRHPSLKSLSIAICERLLYFVPIFEIRILMSVPRTHPATFRIHHARFGLNLHGTVNLEVSIDHYQLPFLQPCSNKVIIAGSRT